MDVAPDPAPPACNASDNSSDSDSFAMELCGDGQISQDEDEEVIPESSTLNPPLQTLNLNPWTLNPKPWTLNPEP